MSRILLAAILTVSAALPVHAQERTYQERLKLYNTVEPLGDSPFGEQIGLYNGSLSFSNTDLTLEGKGPSIVIGRTVDTKVKYWPSIGTLGNWDLTIPRIETLVRTPHPMGGGIPGNNWQTIYDPTATPVVATNQRCTKFNVPYDVDEMQEAWWNGYEFINERGQRQPLMKRSAAYPAVPSMSVNGQAVTFTGITQDNWQMGCLPATTNGQAGEAFLLVSPDGTRYHMTHLVGIPASVYIETWCEGGGGGDLLAGKTSANTNPETKGKYLAKTEVYSPMAQNAGGPGYVPEFAQETAAAASAESTSSLGSGCTQIKYGRMFATMYVTKIEDRFGNYLTYTYDGDKLTSITASDGRSVTINWRTDWRAIDTIVATESTTRTWTYAYAANYALNKVTLPDASTWEYTTLPVNLPVDTSTHDMCTWRVEDPATWNYSNSVGTIKTPSNLIGTFDVRTTFFGRSYVPSDCMQDAPMLPFYEQIPPMFNIGAIHSKSVSGPGITTQTWTYTYSPAVASATHDACASSSTCQTSSWVDVFEPDNSKVRYTFSTRWGSTEGKQLKVETFAAGQSQPMKTVTSQYLAATQGAYVASVGGSMMHWQTNSAPTETWIPLFKQDIVQQGRTFTWQVATGCAYGYCFDSYARPTKVVKSSSP